ncbi:Uncharacterised protein [Vibrio cholerae]|nr:Uncharacterised protein [Vibrio cholerae]
MFQLRAGRFFVKLLTCVDHSFDTPISSWRLLW